MSKNPFFYATFYPKNAHTSRQFIRSIRGLPHWSVENLLITSKLTTVEVELKFKVDFPCSHYFLLVLFQHFNPIDSFQRLNKIQKMISNKKKRSFKRIGFRIRQNVLFHVLIEFRSSTSSGRIRNHSNKRRNNDNVE